MKSSWPFSWVLVYEDRFFVRTGTYIHAYMHTRTYTHTHTYIHIYIYIYIFTHLCIWSFLQCLFATSSKFSKSPFLPSYNIPKLHQYNSSSHFLFHYPDITQPEPRHICRPSAARDKISLTDHDCHCEPRTPGCC